MMLLTFRSFSGLSGSFVLGSVGVGLRENFLACIVFFLVEKLLSYEHVISIGFPQISAKNG